MYRFGIYVVHYLVVLVACSYLKLSTSLPVPAVYLLSICAVLVLSPALYEVLRRIPVLRFLVLGIRGPRTATGPDGVRVEPLPATRRCG